MLHAATGSAPNEVELAPALRVHLVPTWNSPADVDLQVPTREPFDHAMTMLSRDQIVEIVYGEAGRYRSRSLDVAIWRLRRLIETDPSEPRYLQTVWGRGYVFVPDGEVGLAERCGESASDAAIRRAL
jgi:hypothetical protein